MTPIDPELLAAKLQELRQREDWPKTESAKPRLLEILCFLQEMSRRPGGLPRLVKKLIEQAPERFMTKEMQRAGIPPNGQWNRKQCEIVWQAIVDGTPRLYGRSTDAGEEFDRFVYGTEHTDGDVYDDGPDVMFREGTYAPVDLRYGVERFNYPFFKEAAEQKALDRLPDLLRGWCQDKRDDFYQPSYCPQLYDTLCDFLDRHAAEAERAIADTVNKRTLFRELRFAESQGVRVPIIGNSRFGKTIPGAAFCEVRPGSRRLVTVPESNNQREFLEAHADALGITYTPATTTARLKASVEFVLEHTRPFLLYDESHYLIPVNYHRTSAPKRLNWVRARIVDRGLSCGFIATPQGYHETLDHYVKHTNYAMDQWLGRIAPAVVLSDEPSPEDMMAVARFNFPEMADKPLQLLCARAQRSASCIKAIEIAGKRARFLADEDHRQNITLADVKAATEYLGLADKNAAQNTEPGPEEHQISDEFKGRETSPKRSIKTPSKPRAIRPKSVSVDHSRARSAAPPVVG